MDFGITWTPTTFLMVLIVLIFYVPTGLIGLRRTKQKRARKDYFHAVLSILQRVDDDEEAVEQAQVVFKKVSEQYPHVQSRYGNAVSFTEDLLYRIEAFGEGYKNAYGFTFTPNEVDRVAQMLVLMRERQPFGSVSSKYGNLLEMIRHALVTGNEDLGVSNLRQLADDIEVMESTLETQARRNYVSIMVSIVGVVLTLVFGALTVLQLLAPL